MIPSLDMVIKGGRVARFHTHPTLKVENVAEHSYLLAWLVVHVWANMHLGALPRAELIMAALAHDLPEYVLGDMPSPAKVRLGLRPIYRREEERLFNEHGIPDYEGLLHSDEAEVLKFCDNLGGYFKCRYEQLLGNRLLDNTAARYREYLDANIMASQYLPRDYCVLLVNQATADPEVSIHSPETQQ